MQKTEKCTMIGLLLCSNIDNGGFGVATTRGNGVRINKDMPTL